LIDGLSSSYADGVKDREMRALEERLEGVHQRLSSVEQGHGRTGQGATELASSVGELAHLVRRQDRLLSLNSFAAYLIFTVLLCAAFYFLYTDRAGDAEAERDTALAARDAAQARAEGTARQLAARDAADRASAGVLDLLRQRRYREAIAAHRDLAGVELSAAQRQFLADAVAGARSQLVADAALRARQAFDRRDYQRGHDLAKEGLMLTAAGGPALEGPASAELRYVLAASLDKLGRAGEARDAYAAFLTAAPGHEMATRARQRLTRLERAL
jgi:hypothetical protein